MVKTLTQTVQNLLGQKLKAISPDFVAETKDAIYLIETKKEGDIKTNEVQEKAVAALEFCKRNGIQSEQWQKKAMEICANTA